MSLVAWAGVVRRAQSVIERINNRQLYKFCGAAMVPKERVSAFSKVTVDQILACQPAANLTAADVLVHNQTINFAMGAMDPLKRLHFFRDFDASEFFESARGFEWASAPLPIRAALHAVLTHTHSAHTIMHPCSPPCSPHTHT